MLQRYDEIRRIELRIYHFGHASSLRADAERSTSRGQAYRTNRGRHCVPPGRGRHARPGAEPEPGRTAGLASMQHGRKQGREYAGGMRGVESVCRHNDDSENVLARHASLNEAFDPAVRIVEHDHAWARQADEELRRIGEALGPLAVRLEHVGSTAVPGLAAKPILDLQLSVASVEPRADYIGPLQQLGYLFAPDPDSPDLHFFGKPRAPADASPPCL